MAASSPLIIAIDGPSASGKGTIAKRLAAHFGFAHLDTGLLYRAVGLAVLNAGSDPANAEAATKIAHGLGQFYIQEALVSGVTPPPHRRLRIDPPSRGGEPCRSHDKGYSSPLEGEVRWGGAPSSASLDFEKLLNDPALREDTSAVAASKVAAIPGVRAALLQFQKDFCANPPGNRPGAVLDGRDIGTVIAPQAPVKIYVTASTETRAERRFKELQQRGESVTYAAVLTDMQARDARDAERTAAPAKPAPDAVILDTTRMTADEAFAEALKIASKVLATN